MIVCVCVCVQVAIEKKLQAKALLEEVAAANTEQIRRKEDMKERERDEDAKIKQYITHKEVREAVSLEPRASWGEGEGAAMPCQVMHGMRYDPEGACSRPTQINEAVPS